MKLFVYGIFLDANTRYWALQRVVTTEPAVLEDWTESKHHGHAGISKQEGDNVEGLILNIDRKDLEILDRIEGVPSLYHREGVKIGGDFVQVYVPTR